MFAILKALLYLTRHIESIATSLATIADLYRLDMESRGLRRVDPDLSDTIEVSYGAKPTNDGWGD